MARNRGIYGHIEWSDGTPASGLTINLLEKDLIFHDVLPSGTTDAKGNFIISYHPEIYGGKRPLAEKPDISLSFKYLDSKNALKTFDTFYKGIKDEWLRVELKIDDLPGTPVIDPQKIPVGICSELISLKDFINIDDIEANDIWEICIATSTAFSRSRYERVMKLSSWGGRLVVGNIFEGPLSRNEKNLNQKGIKMLNKREQRPNKLELNFIWLDEQDNIIYKYDLQNENMNYINEKGLRILIREFAENGKTYKELPVERLKITSEVQIRAKKFKSELICIDSISALKGFVGSPKI